MATAKVHDGRAIVAYVDGKAVDSDGNEIKGAPKQPKDTAPEEIARIAAARDPVQRLADTLDRTFGGASHAASLAALRGPAEPATAEPEDGEETDSEEEEGLPSLPDMQAHLASVDDVDELKAMRRSDKRKGAKSLYAARIKELEEAQ